MKYIVGYDHVTTTIGTVEIEADSEEEAVEKFQQMADNSEINEDEDLYDETWEAREVF